MMYEDQRSTILAVDNLNGARVLEKTLRVDHVKNYKQPKVKNEDGEWVDPEEQSFNAKPQMIEGKLALFYFIYYFITTFLDVGAESDSSASTGASIDPEDPMRDYLIQQRKEEKALKKTKKSKGKTKHKDETPEERRARKAKKKERKSKKVKSENLKGVEDLLKTLGKNNVTRHRSPSGDQDSYRRPSRYSEEEETSRYRHHSTGESARGYRSYD